MSLKVGDRVWHHMTGYPGRVDEIAENNESSVRVQWAGGSAIWHHVIHLDTTPPSWTPPWKAGRTLEL